jgi:hypothetical protein
VLAAVAVAGAHLHDAAVGRAGRVVHALQHCHLVGLADLVGVSGDGVDHALGAAGERDGAGTAAALTGCCRCGLGGGTQAGLAEVRGVGEPGGVAADDPDAGASIAAAGDLLHPTVVERHGCGPLVLGVHLCKLGAGADSGGEYSFQHVVVDHAGSLARAFGIEESR